MKNRHAGFLVIGISVIIIALVLLFNFALKDIIGATCSHGSSCEMYDTVNIQTWIGIIIAALILIVGLVLLFSKEPEKIVIKKVKEKFKKKKIDTTGLNKSEKEVIKILEKENGAIFQKTLMEQLGVGKVGMTRILDRLESREIIERKRRGMNNIVVLKN